MAYKLNNKGKVAVIILVVVIATLFFKIKKGMTPESPFKDGVVYNCTVLRKEGSAPLTTLFQSYGVYCPVTSDSGEIKINFWKGGEKVKDFKGAKTPFEIKLDGGKLHQVKKGEWDYQE